MRCARGSQYSRSSSNALCLTTSRLLNTQTQELCVTCRKIVGPPPAVRVELRHADRVILFQVNRGTVKLLETTPETSFEVSRLT